MGKELLIEKARLNTLYDERGIFYQSKYLIYIIINNINNNIYIGSTTRGKERYSHHVSELRRNVHGTFHLQSAWNLYGEENFELLIVEWLYFNSDIEKHIIDAYIESIEDFYIKSYTPEYNGQPFARMRHGYSRKEIMGEERYKIYNDKRVAKLMENGHSERMISYNKTRILSDETKAKMSKAQKGRKQSPEHIEAVRKAMIGGKRSEDTKAKMRLAHKESILSGKRVIRSKYISLIKEDIKTEYTSVRNAAKSIGVCTQYLNRCVKLNKLVRGYKVIYAGSGTTGKSKTVHID